MDEPTSVRDLVELLRSLMQGLYLSTACAAGDHAKCRQVDKYRGLPCCCLECGHADLDGSPPPVCLPLLHMAEEGRQEDGYTYLDGQVLGVRTDLYKAISGALELHVHELRRDRIAYDAAVKAALVFAPRIGA
ncbi:hypothetical protein DMB38_20400 [Streptomyces sp. WAC 06738]|uniref:hypothetical protein n=1 Tax=Streptomyces sp. WAC 06738 TaxID=2203210 RepID=UPI000F6F47F3|nr:hypothetical protein [Streptomyces sp. WAC 06738]AZM47833.1 hypothetical protein DMB38_20400 [Streptomyces sp. WAC 06738]